MKFARGLPKAALPESLRSLNCHTPNLRLYISSTGTTPTTTHRIIRYLEKAMLKRGGKKEKSKSKENGKFRELDDSRGAMRKIDSKKAKEKGEEAPSYRPRGEVPKSKRKEAELKAKKKG